MRVGGAIRREFPVLVSEGAFVITESESFGSFYAFVCYGTFFFSYNL